MLDAIKKSVNNGCSGVYTNIKFLTKFASAESPYKEKLYIPNTFLLLNRSLTSAGRDFKLTVTFMSGTEHDHSSGLYGGSRWDHVQK